MASVLSSFFSRDPKTQFGYDIPADVITVQNGISIGRSFKKAEPDEKATIFWGLAADISGSILKQQAHKLKTMRHPNIVTYLDSVELDGKFYLVTEPCVPLSTYITESNMSDEQKEFIVSWGLYQVTSTLKFLHEANVSHESIRRAIYVTPAGDWKISALQNSASFSSPRTDLNQLALVIWEIFNGFSDSLQKPEPPGKMPKRLHDLYKKMATPAAQRTSAAEIIKDCRMTGGFMKNRFVDTLLFLEEFQLKESTEKQAFFTHLRDHLHIFPDDVAKYKILPKLILSYEYGDAGPNILIPLFKLGGLLDEEEYQKRIVPCLVKLFSSPDRTTRVKLLERIDEFAAHLSTAVVNDKIFMNLATGFMDTSPAVRESTVKAMVPLAEKLNSHNLNTELMKHLARLQGTDEHGGIRTNTTISLGKIGCYLEPSSRQKILIGAFTRGMKDPFPPARVAAVLALSATQQFYSLVEVANRIVPALGPLTCDPEKQVRDQAFKAIKGFLEKLEKASENPDIIPELEAQVKAGGKGIFGSDKVPQWASWALKSLSGKFYKGTPPPESGKPATGEGNKSVSESTPSGPQSAPLGTTPLKPTIADNSPKANSNYDGWGTLDDDVEASEDEWADAREPAKKTDGWDDWADDVPAIPSPTEKPASTIRSFDSKQPIMKAKPAAGKLKLGGGLKPKQKTPEADIDSLLGITQPKSEPSGGGWDDFGSTTADSGWDAQDSSSSTNLTSSSILTPKPVGLGVGANKDRDAKRAEISARNEQRKRELAEKRAQREKAKTSFTPANTASSADGWDDF